jgi:hypothetical protein
MTTYKSNNTINGFEYRTMFASVNFSNDGNTPLQIYENETEKVNEDDELCVIEKVYFDGQWKRTTVLDRNIDPSDFTIE